MSTETQPLSLQCVADTGSDFCKRIADCHKLESGREESYGRDAGSKSNIFHSAQFTADGTTVVTLNEDQCLRAFILPSDLIETKNRPQHLTTHSLIRPPTNIQSYTPYPNFDLQNPSTTVLLASVKDVPITLHNLIAEGYVHAKYPWVHPTTEQYIAPSKLVWTNDGTHFVAGAQGQIAIFDCSRDGSGPIASYKAARSSRQYANTSTSLCRGIIHSMSINSNRMLAVGTTQRQISIFDSEGHGALATTFSLNSESKQESAPKGTGVSHLKWSPCGTYLFVAERQSDVVQIYDMRNSLKRLACLTGRNADTTQRLSIDLVPTAAGLELWGGGTDGCVRMWSCPGSTEGDQEPRLALKVHEAPVSSAIWHPSGIVMATCSGARKSGSSPELSSSDDDSSGDDSAGPNQLVVDNTLKFWLV